MPRPPTHTLYGPTSPCRWLRAGVAVLVMGWVLLVLGAAHAASPERRTLPAVTLSNLGAGPASTSLTDPVRLLAIDIAEHLPTGASGIAAPPLPLHAPWSSGEWVLDEPQGIEWASLWPPQGTHLPTQQRPTAPDPVGFDSTDPRRSDRPPTDPDRSRP